MARKRFTAEQIIIKLREAEVGLAQGQTMVRVCKQIGVTEQIYYRWRKEYGGLRLNQAKRLKVLEKENARLKKLSLKQNSSEILGRHNVGLPVLPVSLFAI